MITAILCDSREPDTIKNLDFGIPTAVTLLETGDLWAVCDDGSTLMIERKSPDDFLGSLRDERLIPQLAKLAEKRNEQSERGQSVTHWPYLVITDYFSRAGNKVATQGHGVTGWSWSSLQGALLTIQEMGVFIVYCAGDEDYRDCILRLGERSRESTMQILPARQALLLGPKEQFLASLPGIGVERAPEILRWADRRLSLALIGLVDLSIDMPIKGIGELTRKRIREFLGLRDKATIELDISKLDDEILSEVI
jgi:ERCC4-type nuclease